MRSNVKRLGSVVVAGAVMVALAGCSGGETNAAETPPQTSSSASTDVTPVEATGDECSVKDADNDVEVSFGEMAAASDEWSAEMGRQWRHYYPLTVTNISAETCMFTVGVVAHFDFNPSQYEDVFVALKPGQSYTAQAFNLEEGIDFTADAESATPTKPVEIKFNGASKRLPSPDYYDADITFGAIQGSGAETVLPVTITVNGVAEGQPERASSSKEDALMVNALDAQGNVVASTSIDVGPVIEAGETRVVNLPLGGGNSSGERRILHPASEFIAASSFEVVEFMPTATHRK